MAHAGGRPGGPARLDPDQRKRFLDALRIGNYAEVAARLTGIAPSTLYRWLERGREGPKGQYAEFWEAVKEAEAFAEHSALSAVRRGNKDWVAQMTFMERRFRDRWGRPAAGYATGSAIDAAPVPAAAAVTDDVVVIPIKDRLAGILQAIDRAGKMSPDDTGHADPAAAPESVPGIGRGADG